MSLQLIIALVLTIPIITVITAFVWYLNLGGGLSALKRAGKRSRSAAGSDQI